MIIHIVMIFKFGKYFRMLTIKLKIELVHAKSNKKLILFNKVGNKVKYDNVVPRLNPNGYSSKVH